MKLLFATDLSEPAPTLRQVERLTNRMQADLLVLHVMSPPPSAPVSPVDPMSGMMGFAPYTVYDPSIEENLERLEEDAFRRFLAGFRIPVRPATRSGDPAEMILKDAADEGADLIVLGKRHQSTLERMFVGSVASEVVRKARRPVTLIPIVDEALDRPAEEP